jgi:hypothetical protein
MKLGTAVATAIYLLSLQGAFAQEANDLAPPPPPEVEEEEADAPAQPAEKKKKLDYCGPMSKKVCDGIENIADIGGETWKVGAMGAALCSKSAAIESTRKRRKDRIEYEEQLARLAEDDETFRYTPWEPSETNTEFAQRTANECTSNKEYWCSEMQLAAADIMDPDVQAETLTLVETACAEE